jgi:LacI family transcriptional regulator
MISLRKRGIEPGPDFAVVGFDDIVEAEHYVPALTSVAVDTVGLGERAAHAVLRMIQSRSTRAEDYVGAVKLVVRESSGPDRAGAFGGPAMIATIAGKPGAIA